MNLQKVCEHLLKLQQIQSAMDLCDSRNWTMEQQINSQVESVKIRKKIFEYEMWIDKYIKGEVKNEEQ